MDPQESSGYGGVRNDTEKNEKRSRRTSIKLIQEKQLIQELKQWTDEQFGMAHQDIPGEENLSISDSNLPNEVAPETGLKVKGVNLPVSPTADPAEVKDAAVTWSPWSTMPASIYDVSQNFGHRPLVRMDSRSEGMCSLWCCPWSGSREKRKEGGEEDEGCLRGVEEEVSAPALRWKVSYEKTKEKSSSWSCSRGGILVTIGLALMGISIVSPQLITQRMIQQGAIARLATWPTHRRIFHDTFRIRYVVTTMSSKSDFCHSGWVEDVGPRTTHILVDKIEDTCPSIERMLADEILDDSYYPLYYHTRIPMTAIQVSKIEVVQGGDKRDVFDIPEEVFKPIDGKYVERLSLFAHPTEGGDWKVRGIGAKNMPFLEYSQDSLKNAPNMVHLYIFSANDPVYAVAANSIHPPLAQALWITCLAVSGILILVGFALLCKEIYVSFWYFCSKETHQL